MPHWENASVKNFIIHSKHKCIKNQYTKGIPKYPAIIPNIKWYIVKYETKSCSSPPWNIIIIYITQIFQNNNSKQ